MKHIVILFVSFLLASCASNNVRNPIDYRSREFNSGEQNRIIYRDLTVPRTSSVTPQQTNLRDLELARLTQQMREGEVQEVSTAKPALAAAEPTEVVSVPDAKDPFYIPFYNESSVLPSERLPVLREIVKNHEDGNRYIVVGHSHGQSLVGTAKLAQNRAEVVTNWMIGQGIDKHVIHQTASWSAHRDVLGPPKGVLVYVTGEHNGRFFLALSPFNPDKEADNEPQLAHTGI